MVGKLIILLAGLMPASTGPETEDSINYVDLGLSVLWADCNQTAASSGGNGFMRLDSELCSTYQIPTLDEWRELQQECTWTWVQEYNGMSGYIVSGTKEGFTDKQIFIPADGVIEDSTLTQKNIEGNYASSTASFDKSLSMQYTFKFDSVRYNPALCNENMLMSVRTVKDLESTPMSSFKLNVSKLDMCIYGEYNLSVISLDRGHILPEKVKWSSSDEECASISEKGSIKAKKPGTSIISAVFLGHTVKLNLTVHDEQISYVDLGTGVLWADRNRGAYEIGDYGGKVAFTDAEKFPTANDWEKLMRMCRWEPATRNGVAGFNIYGGTPFTRGNSIFLPCDSTNPLFGYWTSSDDISVSGYKTAILFRMQKPFLNPWSKSGLPMYLRMVK